jgi:hypothetical protein
MRINSLIFERKRILKSSIVRDMMPCGSQLKVNWCFGWKCYLCLQGWRISQARIQREVRLCLPPASYWFLAWLTLQSWRRSWQAPPKVGRFSMDYTGLYPEDRTLHNHCCENLESSGKGSFYAFRKFIKKIDWQIYGQTCVTINFQRF